MKVNGNNNMLVLHFSMMRMDFFVHVPNVLMFVP
jgi:hypothetical protein